MWNRGSLMVLAEQSWTPAFVGEVTSFPSRRNDDQVDALVSALLAVPHAYEYVEPVRQLSEVYGQRPEGSFNRTPGGEAARRERFTRLAGGESALREIRGEGGDSSGPPRWSGRGPLPTRRGW